MPKRASPTPEQLEIAAKWRAQGLYWEGIAKELKCHAGTLRRWIRKAGKDWEAALKKAEAEYLGEVSAEALTTLRKQIHGKDEKAARDASAKVLSTRTSRDRVAKASKESAAPAPSGMTVTQLEDFLLEVPHETLLAAFPECRSAARTPRTNQGSPSAN